MQYQAVGVEANFGRNPKWYENKRWEPSRLDHNYRGFLESNSRMRVNTVHLFKHPLGHPEITHAGPQAVLEMRDAGQSAQCPTGLAQSDVILTYYVAADLSGPSPEIRVYEAGRMRGGAQVVEYKNKLMGASRLGVEFYADLGSGALRRFCEIQPR